MAHQPATARPRRDRFNLSRLAINHAGLTVAFWIAISVAGLFAYRSLEYALFPDITFPVVVVNGSAPLATALETEAQLTVPLEAQLEPLDRLNRIFSTTYSGQSVLNLRFQVGTDLEAATIAVEQALEEMSLPEATRTQVIPLNLNEEAAVSYALVSPDGDLAALADPDGDLSPLADLARTSIIPPLEDIPGVLRVDLLGTARQDLGPAPPAGSSPGLESPTEAGLNPPTLIQFDGVEGLAFQVIKQGDANTLAVVDRVAAVVADLQAASPDVQIILAATQADFIQAATQATIDSLVLAVVIAVLVIFGFLRNWRATLITALAIPISLLGTCIVMALFGFNLETITLLALALVIGIIVDDAIVEVENITRHLEAGAAPKQAALVATQEIGLTVSAATLTIVAVFLPVAFMGGTVGQFFKPFGLTVSAAVLTSLLVARTLSPVLAVYWLRGSPSALGSSPTSEAEHPTNQTVPLEPVPIENHASSALTVEVSQQSWLTRGYGRLLTWALGHRWAVVGLAIASLVAGIALIPLVPQGFIPQLDRGEFNVTYQVPLPTSAELAGAGQASPSPGSPDPRAAANLQINPVAIILGQSYQVAQQLETTVLQNPAVESVLTTVGVRGKPNQGRLYVKLRGDRS
ncbi:MAG: efflux RND transporter permease subunit, partial [Nodosilinea sp.]